MPLRALLYRCPRCGHDPMEGKGDEAWCPACRARIRRGTESATLKVEEPSGERVLPAVALARAITLLGGPLPGSSAHRPLSDSDEDAPDQEGAPHADSPASAFIGDPAASGGEAEVEGTEEREVGVIHEAAVTRSRSAAEEPVRYRGQLLGFAERQGEGEEGLLRLTDHEIRFLRKGEVRDRWTLLELRAVQSSSSLVQISVPDNELVQFRFHSDSPRRWEELVRLALQNAWKRAGRDPIVEFQPRIVTR